MALGWRKQGDAISDISRNMAAALPEGPNDRRHGRMRNVGHQQLVEQFVVLHIVLLIQP